MDIDYKLSGNILIIFCDDDKGTIISGASEDLVDYIQTISDLPVKTVSFDLGKKNAINSAGLSQLLSIKDQLLDAGMGFCLLRVPEKVRELLDMMGILDFFAIYETEEEMNQAV